MTKEIKSLTGLRGIAALWVVLLHFIYVVNFQTENLFLDAGNQFLKKGNLGVDMFFMLSAFVMCLAYQNVFNVRFSFKDIKDYLLKRFIRIYPAYIFWLLLAAFVYKKWSLKVIGVNLMLSQNFFDPNEFVINSVFWSLCAEWWMYMIFPFVFYFLKKANSKKNMSIVFVAFATLLGLYVLPNFNLYFIGNNGLVIKEYDNQFSIVYGINSMVRSLLCYLLGIALFFISINGRIGLDKLFGGTKSIYILLTSIILLSFFRNTEIFIIVCLALLIMSLYVNKDLENIFSKKIIYFLGLISYSLYLLHTTLRFIITVVVMKIFKIPVEAADLPSMLLALILVIPLAYLSYIYIENKTGVWLKAKLLVKPSEKNSPEKELSNIQGSI
ncbi:MAG: acyltransferase [Sporocytophaga sp.]|nr:acyltransferase [Sporocytophaga sp.]